jgi:hypothetical protein
MDKFTVRTVLKKKQLTKKFKRKLKRYFKRIIKKKLKKIGTKRKQLLKLAKVLPVQPYIELDKRGSKFKNKEFNRIIQQALELIFGRPVTIINLNYYDYFLKKKWKESLKIILRRFSFVQRTRVSQRIIYAVVCALKFKDCLIISSVIKFLFERQHYSKHRFIFYMFKYLVRRLSPNVMRLVGAMGFQIVFRGKLGVGGNAKKRRYKYKTGMCSNSAKSLKLNSLNSYVRTATGVFGYTISIYY